VLRSAKIFGLDGNVMPHEQSYMAKVLNGTIHETCDQEVLIERPNGSRIAVVINIRRLENRDGTLAGPINCFYDISGRKLTEKAFIKSEKVADAGCLAATLAREINNPLQAVAILVNRWAQSPGLDSQNQEYAAMAESELRRVTHLAKQALSFYRDSAFPTSVKVEEVIDSVLTIYDTRVKAKGIQITRRYQLDGGTIKAQAGEIRQIFSTLLLNAMEAVESDGTIDVRARKSHHWQNPAIHGVRVTISDNCLGISAANIPSISEPFFTTKGENGTGLGLWVANGIIGRSGGAILLRSGVNPGKRGTCFSIFSPAKS